MYFTPPEETGVPLGFVKTAKSMPAAETAWPTSEQRVQVQAAASKAVPT